MANRPSPRMKADKDDRTRLVPSMRAWSAPAMPARLAGRPHRQERQVIPVFLDPEHDERPIFSGTVTLRLPDAARRRRRNDLTGLAGRFVPAAASRTATRRASTALKYLYLYQIVNDRGLDPSAGEIKLLSTGHPASDVNHFALRLVVDPPYVTAGLLQNSGFEASVPVRNRIGEMVTAADRAKKIMP